jgi:hypothetical protein
MKPYDDMLLGQWIGYGFLSAIVRVRDGDPGREVVGAGLAAELAVELLADGQRSDGTQVRWKCSGSIWQTGWLGSSASVT